MCENAKASHMLLFSCALNRNKEVDAFVQSFLASGLSCLGEKTCHKRPS